MDQSEIVKISLQKILDYQMPTGEWGYYSRFQKDRYLRVKRENYTRPEYISLFRKPNGYRTLTAMEILKDYFGNMYNSRITKGISWFKSNLTSGWFVEWDSFASGPFPDRTDFPYVEKSADVRHTSQALLALLKYDKNPGPELIKGLYNIIGCQYENGMWPRKPEFNHYELFRSACCADLLFNTIQPNYKRKLTNLGINQEFFRKCRIALDKTCAWFVDCSVKNQGLFIDEYQTAMVLERMGKWLVVDERYTKTVENIISILLERIEKNSWTNSGVVNAEVRNSEISRYETTVRVCACLYTIRGNKIWISDEQLLPIKEYLIDKFQPDNIDASDYRYFVQIFEPYIDEAKEKYNKNDFFDIYSKDSVPTFGNYTFKDSIIKTMSLWVIDCLERLQKLSEGKSLGQPNYRQASLEKEEEMISILNSMRLLIAKTEIKDLPQPVLIYLQTGEIEPLKKELDTICENYKFPLEKRPNLSQLTIIEIRKFAAEIIAAYLDRQP
jgi:hypothetical protein